MSFHANSIGQGDILLRDEAVLKQYVSNLINHAQTGEFLKKNGDEFLVMLRKMTHDDTSEDKENASCTNSKAETNSKSITSSLPYEDVKKILFKFPTLAQAISCYESLRKILSETKTPPIADLVESGLLTNLANALNIDNEKIQFESVLTLTNLTSGTSEQTIAVVEAGATQPLIKLVHSDSARIAHQALWALANIAGDSAQLRDCVIKSGGVEAMMRLVDRVDDMKAKHVQTLAWALSNICRHKNADIEVLREISTGFAKLLHYKDSKVFNDVCCAVTRLMDGSDEQRELVLNSGVMQSVVSFLRSSDELALLALRTLGNMATVSDELTQEILRLGILQEITVLLKRTSSIDVIAKTCWLISNVTAGTQDQIQQVIDAGLLGHIVDVLSSGEYKCQVEASWALSNLVQRGTSEQIYALVQEKGLPVLGKVLDELRGVELQKNLLETIYACLSTVSNHYPEQMDTVRASMQEAHGLRQIARLQLHMKSPHWQEFGPRPDKLIRIIRILLEN